MTKETPTALIIGSHGMLGSELVRQAEEFTDWKIVTSDVSDEDGIDITSEESVEAKFEEYQPDIVINCAAYTDVNGCETEKGFELAKKVNGYGPGILAKHSAETGAVFIHISSDYVFGDDKEDGYEEDYDKFKPINKYGESKLLGEQEVLKQQATSDKQKTYLYVVRTSWLFGKGARNFMAKFIELSETHDTLKGVTDEVSCPTYVKDLAQRLIYIAEKKPEPGIYHAAGRGAASRYEFGRKILQVLGKKNKLEPVLFAEFGRDTKIAHYSVLLNTKLPVMRKWEEMVEDFVGSEYKKEKRKKEN